ncbi:GPO family capsid scaffolding protein [Serratia fonticola]
MAKKVSKFFRVVTEGDTVDSRKVERQHIQDMAETYNTSVYGARINIEHFVSMLPGSVFRCYGDVQKARAVEITSGPLAGKLSLESVIEVDDELVDLFGNKDKVGQKIYPSIEYIANFRNTGKAYLVGLGFTDTPAAVGTEIAKFSTLTESHRFAVGDELTAIEFEGEQQPNEQPGLLARIKTLLGRSDSRNNAALAEHGTALEMVAESQSALEEQLSQQQPKFTSMQDKVASLERELTELKTTLANTDADTGRRPLSTGGNQEISTDC